MRNILKDLLQPHSLEAAKKEANRLPAAELVQHLMEIEPKKRALAFWLIDKDKAIKVFEYMRPEQQAELIIAMSSGEMNDLINTLEIDDQVRLFGELPAKVTKQVIANLNPVHRQGVDLLLGFPENSVGRMMNIRYLAVKENITVGLTQELIRESKLKDSQLDLIFVVDNQRYYRGFVRTIDLLKQDSDVLIAELLSAPIVAISAKEENLKAVKLLQDYQLPAIAVLDSEGRLIGDITFDDVIHLVKEEIDESTLSQAGVGNLLSRDKIWSDRLVKGSPWYSIRLRILFLIVTLLGGMLVGGVIKTFEEVIETIPVAAIFIPLVMDMGGNVGTQSTTVFARGMAWEQINLNRYFFYILREARIGLLMGLILGSVSGVIAYFWQGVPNDVPQIGIVVAIALIAVVTTGAVLGALLPWAMLKLGFDHGPGADPLITTIKDFTGLWVYFSLVVWLIEAV